MSVTPANLLRLAERLVANVETGTLEMSLEQTSIPVSHYASPERLALETATLFRRYPIIVAHDSELAEPGSCLAHDALGVPLLLIRDRDGALRCFLNVCRHRGMRLVSEEGVCQRRALVCPYHGWTYSLSGALSHVPHQDAFPEVHAAERGLVPVPVASRHGLVWVCPTPGAPLDVEGFLGSIGEDLDFFGLESHALYRRIDTVRRANWKLVVDAFLEAYHIRVLHRDSIYRFFVDAAACTDHVGPHTRSLAARRAITEARRIPQAEWNLRELFTFTHFVFPNSVFIFHPDYTSHIGLFPVDADHVRWVHSMLVPRELHTEERRSHWERTLDLIERAVFQREDLFAAEGIQAGLRSGANEVLTFGRLEGGLDHFHASVQQAIDDAQRAEPA